MKTTHLTRLLALLLCLLTLTVLFASCREISAEPTGTQAPAADDSTPTPRGEGATVFSLTVTDQDGTQKEYEIHTDAANVADALLELGLISGDDSEYGLYIKVVDGITADYSVDQTYWSLYVNGEYSMVGASSVPVTSGLQVELKKEKME